jgi:hypothetical protein
MFATYQAPVGTSFCNCGCLQNPRLNAEMEYLHSGPLQVYVFLGPLCTFLYFFFSFIATSFMNLERTLEESLPSKYIPSFSSRSRPFFLQNPLL